MQWALKIAAKMALSRLPAGYRLWQSLGIFRHGAMDSAEYALNVFASHYDRFDPERRRSETVALELGPGDSIASAVIRRCAGLGKTILVDSGDFVARDVGVYHALLDALAKRGLEVPSGLRTTSFDELLAACDGEYLTRGLESVRSLPDRSVDFIWSNAVLEHVPKSEFTSMMSELRRVLKPDGLCSHRVDLRDHLAGALNNLRFEESRWESGLFRHSGFYTNRIRYSEMLEIFARCGYSVRVLQVDRWNELPTPRAAMASPFREMANEELCVSGFDVVLTPPEPTA